MDSQTVIEFVNQLAPKRLDRATKTVLIRMIFKNIFNFTNCKLSLAIQADHFVLDHLKPDENHICLTDMFVIYDRQIGTIMEELCRNVNESGDGPSLDMIQQCLKYCGIINDRLWEEMHTRKWTDVFMVTRQAYAYHRWLESLLILAQIPHATPLDGIHTVVLELLKKSIESIDYGLIMSPDLSGQLLANTAGFLHRILVALLDKFDQGHWRFLSHLTDYLQVRTPPTVPWIGHSIEEITDDDLDLIRFERDFFRAKKPFVFRKCVQNWPCMSTNRWTIPFLLRTMAFRHVPVEIGSKYTDDDWSQKIIPVHKLVEDYMLDRTKGVAYLAQYNLFDQVIELCRDFDVPRYCGISETETDENIGAFEINAWFGPAGTVSPLHFDGKHNFLVQIIGTKYIRLYSDQTPDHQIYPNQSDSLLWNTSQVNVENVDIEKFPGFDRIASSLTFECMLHEGDILYIPKNWWHFVMSTADSFSINFWWN